MYSDDAIHDFNSGSNLQDNNYKDLEWKRDPSYCDELYINRNKDFIEWRGVMETVTW